MRRLIQDKIEKRLPRVVAPCLILVGSRDPVVPLNWAQWACDLLPDGQLMVIEGATHTMNYVYPLSFAQAIEPFIRSDPERFGASQ
jgi:pimeloyl-ACP methyl ester carboxylesterase